MYCKFQESYRNRKKFRETFLLFFKKCFFFCLFFSVEVAIMIVARVTFSSECIIYNVKKILKNNFKLLTLIFEYKLLYFYCIFFLIAFMKLKNHIKIKFVVTFYIFFIFWSIKRVWKIILYYTVYFSCKKFRKIAAWRGFIWKNDFIEPCLNYMEEFFYVKRQKHFIVVLQLLQIFLFFILSKKN